MIHNNLTAALEATNITSSSRGIGSRTLNAQAKSAARSAFESAKQRFYNHLITAMKTSTLIKSIERDLEAGHAAVVQLVSTGEALMERRLADIPTEEWGDVVVDVTPKDAVMTYLQHSFPTQLFEEYTDSDGNLASRPVLRDGQPVQCREAVERCDRLIEHLASLDPVPGALDQIVQHFGAERVAEVTGRSRRIVAKADGAGDRRLAVESRAGSANLAETQAFQDDEKRILVFSDAGGTGRSMLDDGTVERRVRLVRPLERPSIAVDALAATAWRPTEPDAFTLAWEAELAQLPEFRESTLHVVTGLLLPVWRQLPHDGGRVYRLQTDDGERIIGRHVSPAWVAAACATVPELTPEDACAGLIGGRMVLHLADGLQLRARPCDARPPHRAHRLHRFHA